MSGIDPAGSGWTHRVVRVVTTCVVLASAGCASSATFRSASSFREENRRNLARLAIGMSRDEVIEVMGLETIGRPFGTEGSGPIRTEEDSLGVTQVQVPVGARGPLLQNPHRTGTYLTEGHSWEVLFYYTDMVLDDDRISDEELTPVVLRDGLLAGVGWDYWLAAAAAAGVVLE